GPAREPGRPSAAQAAPGDPGAARAASGGEGTGGWWARRARMRRRWQLTGLRGREHSVSGRRPPARATMLTGNGPTAATAPAWASAGSQRICTQEDENGEPKHSTRWKLASPWDRRSSRSLRK